MKKLVNLGLLVLSAFLVYFIYASIKEPVAFMEEKNRRKDLVANRLKEVRSAQEIYKSMKGYYAPNFEELVRGLRNDSIKIVKQVGDEDDPTQAGKPIETEVIMESAMTEVIKQKINLDSLGYIPFTNKQRFNIESDTIEYQGTKINVIQVSTRWAVFMGEFADKKFRKYDSSYDPENLIKFGDLNSPSIGGNWE